MDLQTSGQNSKVVKNSEWSSGLLNLYKDIVLGGSSKDLTPAESTTKELTHLTTKSLHIKPRNLTARFSGYNKLKLPILLTCREKYKSLSEIMLALPGQKKNDLASKLSGLVNDYDRPYLRIRKVSSRVHLYKCTKKGLRLGCELFRRQLLGLDLHIPRGKKNRLTHCAQAGCQKCRWNPARNSGDYDQEL